jgi:hypothetical protein
MQGGVVGADLPASTFGEDGKPDFERVCEAVLFRHDEIPLVFIVFDVLSMAATCGRSRTASAVRSSRSYGWTDRSGGCRRLSRMARRCGRRSASTDLRASWPSGCRSHTSAMNGGG